MGEPRDSTVLWNKLGTPAQIVSSEIGNNGTISGSINYSLAKFDNGFYSSADNNGAVTFGNLGISNQGVISCWIKARFASTATGLDVLFQLYNTSNDRIFMVMDYTNSRINIQLITGGTAYIINYNTSWSAGDEFYLTGVWNSAGIDGGSDTARLYVNKDLKGNITNALSFPTFAYSVAGASYASPGVLQTLFYSDLTIIDNIKVNNISDVYQAVLDNSENEGFPDPLSGIISTRRQPNKPRVLLFGDIDIYKKGHIKNIQSVEEQKTFQDDKLIVNRITQDVINIDNFYSLDNPKSPLNGLYWRWKPYIIYDKNNQIIWNGIIKDIKRDYNSSPKIVSEDTLSAYQKNIIEYESADWETPSDSMLNILNGINYPASNINLNSFNRSKAVQESEGVYIKCNFNKSSEINLQSVLNKLSKVGFADTYISSNKINHVAWEYYKGGFKAELNEADLYGQKISIESPPDFLINQYSIFYDGSSTPATDSNSSDPVGELSRSKHLVREFVFNGGTGENIVIKDITSAHAIGQNRIKRVHSGLLTNPQSLQKVSLSVSIENENWIDLKTYFKLNFKNEGWTGKIFEIFKIRKNYDSKLINMDCYEISS